MQRCIRVLSAALVVLTLGGCGQSSGSGGAESEAAGMSAPPSPPSSAGSGAPTSEPASGTGSTQATDVPDVAGRATISSSEVESYGDLLVDGDDLTLYVFFSDTDGRSTCYDTCADNWPPVLTDGAPRAKARSKKALLGTTERDDGAVQVTYDGQPLYRYSGDSAPGDVLGFGSGDVWYPVAPDGAPIDVAEGRGDNDDGY